MVDVVRNVVWCHAIVCGALHGIGIHRNIWPHCALPIISTCEEDTAEMSRLAAEEASRCIAADGSIVERRLRTLLLTAQPRLAKQALADVRDRRA